MMTIETLASMQHLASTWKKQGHTIGLVPTMGFLHAGHVSLIERARRECDKVVVSIFVNPIQFGPNEDFDKYPRDPEGDRKACELAGADAIFMPAVKQMYPLTNLSFVDISGLSDMLWRSFQAGSFSRRVHRCCQAVQHCIC